MSGAISRAREALGDRDLDHVRRRALLERVERGREAHVLRERVGAGLEVVAAAGEPGAQLEEATSSTTPRLLQQVGDLAEAGALRDRRPLTGSPPSPLNGWKSELRNQATPSDEARTTASATSRPERGGARRRRGAGRRAVVRRRPFRGRPRCVSRRRASASQSRRPSVAGCAAGAGLARRSRAAGPSAGPAPRAPARRASRSRRAASRSSGERPPGTGGGPALTR